MSFLFIYVERNIEIQISRRIYKVRRENLESKKSMY